MNRAPPATGLQTRDAQGAHKTTRQASGPREGQSRVVELLLYGLLDRGGREVVKRTSGRLDASSFGNGLDLWLSV